MSAFKSAAARELADILAGEIDHAADLHAALQTETDQLSSGGYDALAQVAAHKERLIAGLGELQRRHAQVLAAAGYAADASATEQFIRELTEPDRARLQSQLQRLTDLLRACRDRNLVNGSVIGMSLRHTRQAFALLCGRDTTEPLYDPTGNTAAAATQRHRSIKA